MFEIFQFGFMVRAFIAGGVIGVACPILGTFLVLRRLSLMSETLSHVALTGAAVGLLLNWSPIMVALIVSAVAAVIVEWLRASNRLADDSALALVLYTALAIAVVLIGLGKGFSVDIFSYLFGSIVTVGIPDLWATAALGIAVLGVVWLFYNELVQSTFDPDLARVSGVKVWLTNMALAVLTGVTVTLSIRLVGALLVGALIVFPVLASLQLGRSFRVTLLTSGLFGLVSVFAGLTISYYQDVPAGGAIVLTALALLVLVVTLRKLLTKVLQPSPSR